MEIVISVLLVLFTGKFGYSAVLRNSTGPPCNEALQLLNYNEKTLHSVLRNISSEKFSGIFNTFQAHLEPYLNEMDKKYENITNETETFRKLTLNMSKEVDIKTCDVISELIDMKYPPKHYKNVIRDCLQTHKSLYVSDKLFFETNVYLRLRMNSKTKFRLHGCAENKLVFCRGICAQEYNRMKQFFPEYIAPFVKEVEEVQEKSNFLETVLPIVKTCTEDNDLLNSFWEDLEKMVQELKECVNEESTDGNQ